MAVVVTVLMAVNALALFCWAAAIHRRDDVEFYQSFEQQCHHQPTGERYIKLEMSEDDWLDIHDAITARQMMRTVSLPPGSGNLAGRYVASICRWWLDEVENEIERGRDVSGEC